MSRTEPQDWVLMKRRTRRAELLVLVVFSSAESAMAYAEGVMGLGRAGYSVVGLHRVEGA